MLVAISMWFRIGGFLIGAVLGSLILLGTIRSAKSAMGNPWDEDEEEEKEKDRLTEDEKV